MIRIYRHRFKLLSFAFSVFFTLTLNFVLHAQYENVWVFGRHAGLDFNSGVPMPIKTSITGFGEANASVCDAHGQLLFYTEGTVVWDKNGNVMLNGDNILPTVVNPGDMTPTSSSCQGALIMPIPGSDHEYYIFSVGSFEAKTSSGYLYYSVVDMSLNNGLGAVVNGQKGVLLDSNLVEKMTAVTGDRCNVWLLVHARLDNTFKAYSISESGVNTVPKESHVGALYGPFFTGQIAFSPNGNKLAVCNIPLLGVAGGDLEILDFDRATGVLSNAVVLDRDNSYYGAAFSPDNSKLYGSTNSVIYQYDLTASEPKDTKTAVGPVYFSHLKLAPDGKIYFLDKGLSVINFPNLAGAACQLVSGAVDFLPGTSAMPGLPNVVSVVIHDTAYTSQSVSAGCFANTNLLTLKAADSSGWDYEWNTGLSGPSFTTVRTPGTYWIRYHTPPCVFHTDTFHVSFPNGVLPDIHIQNSCKGFTNGKAWATTYPGDTVTYHYFWQNSNQDTLSLTDTLQNISSGKYTLRVTTAHCDTTLSFFLPEENHTVAFLADSIICQGTELQFTNTSDSSFTQFNWKFGDEDSSALRSPSHTYGLTGSYRVMLIGVGKICTDTAHKTITVDSLFPGTFLTDPDSICSGQEAVSFYPQTDSSALSLHWDFGDGTEMTSNNEEKIQHAYETAGIMPVTFKVHFRVCPDTSFTDTVYVYAVPRVNLGPDTGLCLNGAPILLKNLQGLPGGNDHYRWNTGDTTPNLKVVHPGMYSLTISSEPLNCSNKATIKITKDCYINVPNAFTPNGDGTNDYFFPRQLLTQKVTQFHMQVFNRWGELLFETGNINGRGWDGKFNGKSQPEGVYVYLIDAELDGARKEHYQGNVTLIR